MDINDPENKSGKYILQGRTPVPEPDLEKWARWIENDNNRRVRLDTIRGIKVSTVFLALDHQWGEGRAMLFETMIFGGKHDQYQTRCSTWEEAEAMHDKAIGKVLEAL